MSEDLQLAMTHLHRERPRRPNDRAFDLSDVAHESDGVPLEVSVERAEKCRRTCAIGGSR